MNVSSHPVTMEILIECETHIRVATLEDIVFLFFFFKQIIGSLISAVFGVVLHFYMFNIFTVCHVLGEVGLPFVSIC